MTYEYCIISYVSVSIHTEMYHSYVNFVPCCIYITCMPLYPYVRSIIIHIILCNFCYGERISSLHLYISLPQLFYLLYSTDSTTKTSYHIPFFSFFKKKTPPTIPIRFLVTTFKQYPSSHPTVSFIIPLPRHISHTKSKPAHSSFLPLLPSAAPPPHIPPPLPLPRPPNSAHQSPFPFPQQLHPRPKPFRLQR